MRPDTLSKLAVTAAICATVASGIAVGMANGRINDLEMQRDIYKSRAEDWEGTAGIVAQYADDLADELKIRSKLDEKLDVEYAGIFKCTAYCTEEYAHICGEGHGITSSGAKVQPGVTAAADISILPYGTVVYIENVGLRVIQDTGSAVKGNKLDVCVNTHEEALSWSGYGSRRVWIVSGGENQ